MAREAEEGFFEGLRQGLLFEGSGGVESDEVALFEDGDAMSEEFDFGERVGCEEKRRCAGLQDLGFEEAVERGGGDGVEAARGLVEKEDAWCVQERASETKALDGAGRERTDLAVEGFGQFKLRSELSDAIAGGGTGKMVELTEEEKILAAGEPGIKAEVAARVVAEIATNFGGRLSSVVTGDAGAAAGGKKKCGENAE